MSNILGKYQSIPFNFPPKIIIEKKTLEFSPHIKNHIDALWERDREKKQLYDGDIITVIDSCPESITIGFTTYRYYYAKYLQPQFFSDLHICILAAGGISETSDGIIIGKRSKNVLGYQGLWECVPSGNIEVSHLGAEVPVWHKTVLAELEEEIGLKENVVFSVDPKGFLVDTVNTSLSFISNVKIDCSTKYIKEIFSKHTKAEFSEINIIHPQRLFKMLEDKPDIFVPPLSHVLSFFKR